MDQNLGKPQHNPQQNPARYHGSDTSRLQIGPPPPPPVPPSTPTPDPAAPQQQPGHVHSASAHMFYSPFRQPAMPPVNVNIPRPPILISPQHCRSSAGQCSKPGNSSKEIDTEQHQQQLQSQQQSQYGIPGADQGPQQLNRIEWSMRMECGDSSDQDYRRYSDRSRKRTVFFTETEPGTELDEVVKSGRKRSRGEDPTASEARDSLPEPWQYNFYSKKGKGKAEVVKSKSKSDIPVEPVIPDDWLTIDKLKDVHPIGHMVFAKLSGYPWWPCFVISHRFSLSPQGQVIKLWVRWYGENDMSHVPLENIKPFEEFGTRFSPREMRHENYRTALFIALETAAKRCNMTPESDPADKTPNWVFPEGQPVPILVGDRDFFDSGNSSSEGSKKKKKKKKMKSSKKSEDVYLSTYEHELLEWALSGFHPYGAAGLMPSALEQEELEQEVEAVPDSPVKGQKKGGAQAGGAAAEGSAEEPTKKQKQKEKKKKKKPKDKAPKPMLKANFVAVSEGKMAFVEICISCGEESPGFQHPLFEGSLCKDCKDLFLQRAYQFDEDGSQMYCTICSGGDEVYMCDTEDCVKVFCGPCIKKLCGPQELKEVIEAQNWTCYICKEVPRVGLLAKRPDWDSKLKTLFDKDRVPEISPPSPYPPIPLHKRSPLRVLSLFDGTGAGFLLLKELGLKVDKFIAAKFSPKTVTVPPIYHKNIIHLGDSLDISTNQMMELGPFDLVIGGSPSNELISSAGKGLYESDIRYFLEFYRLLDLAIPNDDRPFFWLYENVVPMLPEDKHLTSRFLNRNPVVVDAKDICDSHCARYIWSNMAWMYSQPQEEAAAVGQAGNGVPYTEEDKLFRFPEFYHDTDSGLVRSRHLGKTWSVSVLKHLLAPLRSYFEYGEEMALPLSLASSSTATDTATDTAPGTAAPDTAPGTASGY